jgi:hypothetical protein
MRSLVPKLLIASIALLAAASLWVPAAGAVPALLQKFELGTELDTNNKITAGPDGNMWFTLPGKKVGSITPAGLVQEFELEGIEGAIGIAAGPEGRIWIVANGEAASFLPADPPGTEEDFESAKIQAEPQIVLGPEGLFWVASNNKVAKFAPKNFNGIAEVTLAGELMPKDIDVAGPLIVIADKHEDPVTETGRIVTFTAAGVQRDVEIPGGSQGVAGAPTGQVAFSASEAEPEQAGLFTPPAPAAVFALPKTDPFGVAYGADQAFWIVQFAAGQLTRVSASGQTSVLGGLPLESARQIAAGPDHTLWITMIKKAGSVPVSAIVRVSGVEPAAPPTMTTGGGGSTTSTAPPNPPVPNTQLGKGLKKVVATEARRATVRVTFTSTVAGSSFQCSLVKVPAPKKGKKPKPPKPAFAGCTSPRVLHLAPGKYRFAVRAVAAGGTDGSPAASTFTVVHEAHHPKHR